MSINLLISGQHCIPGDLFIIFCSLPAEYGCQSRCSRRLNCINIFSDSMLLINELPLFLSESPRDDKNIPAARCWGVTDDSSFTRIPFFFSIDKNSTTVMSFGYAICSDKAHTHRRMFFRIALKA